MRIAIAALGLVLAGCAGTPSTPGAPATPDLRGQIVFTQPAYSCKAGGAVWKFTAYLKDRAGGLKLTLVMASTTAAGEKPVDQTDLTMTSPDNTQLSDGPIDVASFCGTPFGIGDYAVRLVRPSDAAVLAEGHFSITK